MKPHDKLDAYIDQQTPTGEYPIVDQLFASASQIQASPALRRLIAAGAIERTRSVRLPHYAAAAAVLVISLVALFSVPGLRAAAAELLGVFVPTEQNPAQEPTVAPPPDYQPMETGGGPEVLSGLTMDELKAEVADALPYELRTPGWLPEGYHYDSGMVSAFASWASLIYVSEDRLSVIQINIYDPNNDAIRVNIPVGPDAVMETVSINGQPGEYVRGDYDLDGNWDSSRPVYRLMWRAEGLLFLLTLDQSSGNVTLQDLIQVAESIAR